MMAEEAAQEQETQNGKQIASRGVPSDEALYLPAHNSAEIRSFQDKDENIARNLWNLEEVLNFVFSKKYQPKYYEIALGFLKLLSAKLTLGGDEISAYVKEGNISKATFYNRVLPRLRKVGMVKVERETIVAQESKRKFRPMVVSMSRTFGNYLVKIGDSWLALVDDARSRKQQQMKL
jgi:predicted transcriptional regulator